jgi:transposase
MTFKHRGDNYLEIFRLSAVPTPAEVRHRSAEQIIELAEANAEARRQLAAAQRQLDWFRRQLFGQKSEKRRPEAPMAQLSLGEFPVPDAPPPLPG